MTLPGYAVLKDHPVCQALFHSPLKNIGLYQDKQEEIGEKEWKVIIISYVAEFWCTSGNPLSVSDELQLQINI